MFVRLEDLDPELRSRLDNCPTYGPAGGEYVDLAAALDAAEMAALAARRGA